MENDQQRQSDELTETKRQLALALQALDEIEYWHTKVGHYQGCHKVLLAWKAAKETKIEDSK